MTIAMCYLSPEGVVLGADSTASVTYPDGTFHYFNHAQKLFQIGDSGSLGLLTWGLGGLGEESYRTQIAELADSLESDPAKDVEEVAQRWARQFQSAYSSALAGPIARCKELAAKQPFQQNQASPSSRSEEEEIEFIGLREGLVVGFCIAGAVQPNRRTTAFQVVFEPLSDSVNAVQVFGIPFWGAPNMIQRLISGADPALRDGILRSGKWEGTEDDLDAVMGQQQLSHAILPVRDAIDFVHTCIYSTIKALKFSSLKQICGGPIEIAVITTDRPFRWVRHKSFDAAIAEGDRL